MAARNRGRQNTNQDADEERRLWKEITDRAKDVDGIVVGVIPHLHLHYMFSMNISSVWLPLPCGLVLKHGRKILPAL